MFEVPDVVPDVAGFEDGTSLLVTGPSTQARGVVFDVLATAHEHREGTVVIATDGSTSAERAVEAGVDRRAVNE